MNYTLEQKLDILLALYITAIMAAELLGSKVTTIMGVSASVGILALPITFTINDVVAEVAGKARARHFVRTGLMMLVVLLILTMIALVLPPAARFQASHPAYLQVFGKSMRIMIASLIAFFLSEMFDVYVYSKIREKLGKKHLWLRNNLSNFIGQFADTFVFMMLAFYRPGNFWFVISLIIPYWLLKCAFSIIETPFTYLGVAWLKNSK
ncbi:MAG TPA: queuosine precursor transporter [Vitreimonas sp.]|nr:queuosine precursor transporter [Vitreimonas sp.]